MSMKRVTVTLPAELVDAIDRLETNRSRFVTEAVGLAFEQRRRESLRRSLAAPHPESGDFAEEGFEAWADGLAGEDSEGLLDSSAGHVVRWVSGEGWVDGRE